MQDKSKQAAWLASLGAGLEYYDFIIYGMMAAYLTPLFFPNEESWVGLLKVYSIFAIGYFIRPFGGIFFGLIGDRYGRKQTFLAIMFIMAISTFCIGLLPTYAQIGGWSSLLLITLRIFQGLSFGAELPGAITVVCEYSLQKKQGTYTGYVISSVSFGATLATLVLYVLSHNSSESLILQGLWRVPFLLGGLLAFANYFIRKHLAETPEFSGLPIHQRNTSILEPLSILIKLHWRKVLLGIGMTWLVSSLVIFSLYLPIFLSQHYGQAVSDVYASMTWAIIWSAVSLPFIGMLSDKVGKKKMFMVASLTFAFLGLALFKIIDFHNQPALILFMVLYQTFISCLTVGYWPLLAELFPTQVRYTGLAACYNITYSLMGCLPLVMTFLIQTFQTPNVAIIFLLAGSIFTTLSTIFLFRRFDSAWVNSKIT